MTINQTLDHLAKAIDGIQQIGRATPAREGGQLVNPHRHLMLALQGAEDARFRLRAVQAIEQQHEAATPSTNRGTGWTGSADPGQPTDLMRPQVRPIANDAAGDAIAAFARASVAVHGKPPCCRAGAVASPDPCPHHGGLANEPTPADIDRGVR